MTQKNSSKIISVVHPICCGLDVHKDMVSACIIITEPEPTTKDARTNCSKQPNRSSVILVIH